MKFEGTESETGIQTVLPSLNGVSRRRNVRACYQLQVQTRKKQRGNSKMKTNNSDLIHHPLPLLPKKEKIRELFIAKKELCKPRSKLLSSLKPSLGSPHWIHHSLFCATLYLSFYWPQCRITISISLPLLLPLTCSEHPESSVTPVNSVCLVKSEYSRKLTKLNMNKSFSQHYIPMTKLNDSWL